MDEIFYVFGWLFAIFAIVMFGFFLGGLAGEQLLRDKMIDCHRLTKDAEQCYSFIILNDTGRKIQ